MMRKNEATCIPASIILKCLHQASDRTANITSATIEFYMRHLSYKDLLEFENPGIKISNLPQLEKKNSPFKIPFLLAFPFLRNYEAFSINVFRIHFHKHTNSYTLFPTHLSPNFENAKCYQIDLLLDTEDVRCNPLSTDLYKHVLLILNLPRLLSSFKSTQSQRHSEQFTFVCRKCCTVFRELGEQKQHTANCSASSTAGSQRRVTQNRFVHKTTLFLKKLNKHVPHVLKYNPANLYKTIVPTTQITMDFEATTRPFQRDTDQHKLPKNAVFEQKPLGASYSIKTLYPSHELPTTLKEPRVMFFDDTKTNEKKFYLNFFKGLRSDIAKIHSYESQVMSTAQQTPSFNQLSISEKIRFLAQKNCEICLARFGSKRKTPEGKIYRVKKCIDHVHVKRDENNKELLRYVCCFNCNAQLMQSAVTNKVPRTIFLHNGKYKSNYSHLPLQRISRDQPFLFCYYQYKK